MIPFFNLDNEVKTISLRVSKDTIGTILPFREIRITQNIQAIYSERHSERYYRLFIQTYLFWQVLKKEKIKILHELQ